MLTLASLSLEAEEFKSGFTRNSLGSGSSEVLLAVLGYECEDEILWQNHAPRWCVLFNGTLGHIYEPGSI